MNDKLPIIKEPIPILLQSPSLKIQKDENEDIIANTSSSDRCTGENCLIPLTKEETEMSLDQLNHLFIEEKIGQLLLVSYPEDDKINLIQSINLGGFVLFLNDFTDLIAGEGFQSIKTYPEESSIPMIIDVNEEGGTVIRISSHPTLIASKLLSPQNLYQTG